MVVWFSMTKPTVAVAIAQQWERGNLELDDRVADHLPEFADPRQGRHHAAAPPHPHRGDPGRRLGGQPRARPEYWDEIVAGICAVRARSRLGPRRACRLPPRRRDDPARRDRAPVRRSALRAVRPRRGVRTAGHDRLLGGDAARAPVPPTASGSAPCTSPPTGAGGAARRPRPGGRTSRAARPAVAGAARCASWPACTRRCSPAVSSTVAGCSPRKSVEAITARHRVGLYDETYHVVCDWGLGFAIDAYGMGRHASPRAFGHGGALSAISFADPEHGLVAVMQTNGMCSQRRPLSPARRGHRARSTRISASCRAAHPVATSRSPPSICRVQSPRSDEHHGRQLDDHQGRRREARRRGALRGAGVHRRRMSTRRSSGARRWSASSRTRPTRWHTYPAVRGGDVEVMSTSA